MKCGDPSVAGGRRDVLLRDHQRTAGSACPTTCAIDSARPALGRDRRQLRQGTGRADGLWAVETEGEARGTSKHFFRVPGRRRDVRPVLHARRRDAFPRGSASGRSGDEWKAFGRAVHFEDPSTRWPDFKPACRRVPRWSPSPSAAAERSGPETAAAYAACSSPADCAASTVVGCSAFGAGAASSGAQVTRLRPLCLAA